MQTKRVKILRAEAIGRWTDGDVVDMMADNADQYLEVGVVEETEEEPFEYVPPEPEPEPEPEAEPAPELVPDLESPAESSEEQGG